MIDIIQCDFKNVLHCEKVIELIDAYMRDPMGGGDPMPLENKKSLIEGLAAHPNAFVLFALYKGEYVGISTCFVNFSTFKVKPFIYVHDLAVLASHRGKGAGRKLLGKVIEIAQEKGYCKVTLEVRNDNANAQVLYKDLGFDECDPVMHYWEKMLV
ncbi:MAG TPA: GNAT family N-acetyltransferase [Bacteroidales bacterium]|nr:GNAT family N-acetyltransferase [Bacteroidales bacterium]